MSRTRSRSRRLLSFGLRLSARPCRSLPFEITNCDFKQPRGPAQPAPGLHRAGRRHALQRPPEPPRGSRNVEIMRAFVRLRRLAISHADLAQRLDELEARYDVQLKAVFEAIRKLMEPTEPPRRPIGFRAKLRKSS